MAKGDLYLRLTGMKSGKFKGESHDDAHVGDIDIEAWSWSMEAPTDGRTGQRTGRATLRALSVTKRADTSSPSLMGAMSSNEVLTALLIMRKTGGKKAIDYMTVKLTNAIISSYEIAWQETPVPSPVERLEFRFARIEVSYAGQDATGAATGSTLFVADSFSPV